MRGAFHDNVLDLQRNEKRCPTALEESILFQNATVPGKRLRT